MFYFNYDDTIFPANNKQTFEEKEKEEEPNIDQIKGHHPCAELVSSACGTGYISLRTDSIGHYEILGSYLQQHHQHPVLSRPTQPDRGY